MTISNSIRIATAASIAAAALAPVALGGEAKNELPFTRAVASGTATQAAPLLGHHDPALGEAKNGAPFTRPVATATTIVVRNGGGFAWTDAAIGAASGAGAVLAAAGALALALGSRRRELRAAL